MPELCLSRSASPNSLKRSSSKSVSGNFRKAACGLIGSRIGTYCRSQTNFKLSRWPTEKSVAMHVGLSLFIGSAEISYVDYSPRRVSSFAISPWSHGHISSRSVSVQAFRSNRWFDHN